MYNDYESRSMKQIRVKAIGGSIRDETHDFEEFVTRGGYGTSDDAWYCQFYRNHMQHPRGPNDYEIVTCAYKESKFLARYFLQPFQMWAPAIYQVHHFRRKETGPNQSNNRCNRKCEERQGPNFCLI